ncbi:unnamed protein product [Spirodela intermedia]|uniref:Uncharacterized protein n=1 Tax=Spirodela intermedia TaxID=51605 RepID=A0A7I8JKJ5_SPIIN|nr:unnamed protein product [Spirodela intermedia]CAA6670684.1 unnamed protein product [Spirodela intermedia]
MYIIKLCGRNLIQCSGRGRGIDALSLPEEGRRRRHGGSPLFPSKRLKAPSPAGSPHPAGKGKRKMEEFASGEDEDRAADGRACGICFAEERRSIRGWIDCCDHYFCFVCIMEWAKIESRCPLCKQRFGSIRRPGVPGVFFRERIVHVPVRNQVQLFDNATEDDDPYANINCSICHNSADENLLLLCDLCDSSAHTYCIGLGFTVPEGDWYCPDCTVSRKEQSRMQDDDHHSDELLCRVSINTTEADPLVSIFDIVHDEGSSNTLRESRAQALRRVVGDSRPTSRRAGARTLHQHRDRHQRIQLLRENWSKFQSGSMDFRSSSASACGASSGREHKPGHRHSTGNVEAVTRFKSPEVKVCTSSYDVDRAWKMLEIAKPMKRVQPTASYQSQRVNGNDSMRARISHRRILSTNRDPENRSPAVGATGIGACISPTPFEVERENTWDKFKEIARIATHTILAACRLDHSKSFSQPILPPICPHQDEANYRSSLLPGSCRDCFFSFVKYVVDVIASERMVVSWDGSNPA